MFLFWIFFQSMRWGARFSKSFFCPFYFGLVVTVWPTGWISRCIPRCGHAAHTRTSRVGTRKPTKNSSKLKGFPARGGGHDCRRGAARGEGRVGRHTAQDGGSGRGGEVGGAAGGASALIAATFRPTAATSGSWQASECPLMLCSIRLIESFPSHEALSILL